MVEPVFERIPLAAIRPNPWNPNAMDDAMYAKAIESIHSFGFIDPVTVRETDDAYEIVDGEHRWKAAKEHSGNCLWETAEDGSKRYVMHVPMDDLPIANLGRIPDTAAQQLTIVLNETRGEYDPRKMGVLLTKLVAVEPLPKLLDVLPFSREKFEELAELPKVDWNALDKPAAKRGGGGDGEKWVERVYRLPAEAAQQLDDAIRAARDEPRTPDWRALQTIAEHFLGS